MSERDQLKARATELKIEFKGNISNKGLKDLIAAAEAKGTEGTNTSDTAASAAQGTGGQQPSAPRQSGQGAVAAAQVQNPKTASQADPAPQTNATPAGSVSATVLDNLKHDGQDLEAGDPVALTQKQFDRLSGLGVVEAADATE